MSLFGLVMYSFGVAVTFLGEEQKVSLTAATLHSTAFAAGAVIGSLLQPWLARHYGRGPALRIGSIGVIIGIALFISGWSYPVTMFGAFLISFTGFFAVVGINAFVVEYQGRAAPSSLSEMNALMAAFGLAGPLIIGIGVGMAFGWRLGFIVALVGWVLIELARGRNLEVYDAKSGHPENEPGHDPGGRLPKGFWVYWIVGALVVGSEFTLILLGITLLQDRSGLGAAAASAALATIIGGMLIGRLAAAPLVARFSSEVVLRTAIVVALMGFAVLWITPNPVVMIVGLTLTGIGMGPHFPLAVNRAVQSSGGRSDRASSRFSIAGSVASGVAPFVIAVFAESIGIHMAFLLTPMLFALMLFFVWRFPPRTPSEQGTQQADPSRA